MVPTLNGAGQPTRTPSQIGREDLARRGASKLTEYDDGQLPAFELDCNRGRPLAASCENIP